METMREDGRLRTLMISITGALLAGLCCLTPVVMVSLGLTSVVVANNWGNLLYGEYRWHFRLLGLALVAFSMLAWFRSHGVCTLDDVKRQRNRIINLVVLALVSFEAVYVLWTYVILHWWGIAAGLPWSQWNEDWAVPVSIGLAAAAAILYLFPRRVPGNPVLQSQTAPSTSGEDA